MRMRKHVSECYGLLSVMKPISEQVHNSIISLLDAGLSSRQIAAQLGVGHTTVDKVRAATRQGIQKCRAGQPAKLSAADKRRLIRMVISGKADTATQLTQELRNTTPIKIRTETILNALKEAGPKALDSKKNPRLFPRHKRQRMDCAVRYQYWTVDDWKRVIWSDETKLNRLGSDECKWVWKEPGSAPTDQHVKGTLKYGGGSLMMGGHRTAQSVGYACWIDGRIGAALYSAYSMTYSCRRWSITTLIGKISSSRKTTTTRTPPPRPANGLKTTELRFWTNQHNP